MPRGKTTEYDDHALVLAISMGERTYEQIGEQFGLSGDHVRKIALGQRRPRLRAEIEEVVHGYLDQARRLGARLAVPAMMRLGRLLGGELDEPAAVLEVRRKAVMDTLHIVTGLLKTPAPRRLDAWKELEQLGT
ncbi:MAG TPA: hypothetical protein VFJ30_06930 [Phycisphaerae bacterium]|nr:hypothetical protein [Phycisphaerae bacterium]